MASSDDAALTKMGRSQLARRYVHTSLLNVRVSYALVCISGVIRALRTHGSMGKGMQLIPTVLRSKPGIRDSVWDVTRRA